MRSFSQDVMDRANEWVSENHPGLEGKAYDEALHNACADLDLVDTTASVNEHRAALGRAPLPSAGRAELALVELCAKYGADRWGPGMVAYWTQHCSSEDLLQCVSEGDPDAVEWSREPEHPDMQVAFRAAARRGLLDRG